MKHVAGLSYQFSKLLDRKPFQYYMCWCGRYLPQMCLNLNHSTSMGYAPVELSFVNGPVGCQVNHAMILKRWAGSCDQVMGPRLPLFPKVTRFFSGANISVWFSANESRHGNVANPPMERVKNENHAVKANWFELAGQLSASSPWVLTFRETNKKRSTNQTYRTSKPAPIALISVQAVSNSIILIFIWNQHKSAAVSKCST